MDPLAPPYVSEHKYYGDQWLEFHDFLDSITDREGIFMELSFRLGLIGPQELAYKNGQKEQLLNSMKCLIAVNHEPDKSKHGEILKKYNVVILGPPPTEPKKDSMYG